MPSLWSSLLPQSPPYSSVLSRYTGVRSLCYTKLPTIYFTYASAYVSMLGEGNGTPLQYSCLENPMDGGACWATVHGVAKSRTWLSDFTFPFHFHVLEKEMATHSRVLAWRIPGTGEPGGQPSMGSHRVGHDWCNLAAAAACFNAALSIRPTLSFSCCVRKSVLYACISIAALQMAWAPCF